MFRNLYAHNGTIFFNIMRVSFVSEVARAPARRLGKQVSKYGYCSFFKVESNNFLCARMWLRCVSLEVKFGKYL
jgi:hypothetical protein